MMRLPISLLLWVALWQCSNSALLPSWWLKKSSVVVTPKNIYHHSPFSTQNIPLIATASDATPQNVHDSYEPLQVFQAVWDRHFSMTGAGMIVILSAIGYVTFTELIDQLTHPKFPSYAGWTTVWWLFHMYMNLPRLVACRRPSKALSQEEKETRVFNKLIFRVIDIFVSFVELTRVTLYLGRKYGYFQF